MTPEHSSSSSGAELRAGDTFAGRYQVLESLGAPAAAAVYKVQDMVAGDVLCLKRIKPLPGQDARAVAGFQRDMAKALPVSHPNLVRIRAIGEDPDTGLPFLLTDFVEGKTLARVMSESARMSLTRFRPVFRQVCEALQSLHSNDLVHGDVSPGNLMVGNAGAVTLLDFGLTRYLAVDPASPPPYMPPELLMRRPLTPASDLFSFGAVCFEMLTGRKPFGQLTVEERCASRPPQVQASGVPSELALAIEKCLEPEAANRFQSVRELKEATSHALKPAEVKPTKTLADALPDDPPEPHEVVPLILQVLQCISKLHESGQSHTELCPRNLKIGANGEVELELISSGAAQGTLMIHEPKYSSPDAFMGSGGGGPEAQVAADIYSLGFIFYEMLLGRTLFEQQFASVLAEQGAILAWLKWHGDLEHKARPVKELVPKCPGPISDLVAKMTEKKAENRLKSLAEVTQTLQQFDARMASTQMLDVKNFQLPPKVEEMKKPARKPAKEPAAVEEPRRFPYGAAIPAALLVVAAVMAWLYWSDIAELLGLAGGR